MKKNINVKVDLPTGSVEVAHPISLVGVMHSDYEPGKQHLLFVPDEGFESDKLKFQGSFKLFSHSDGSVEMIRVRRPRAQGETLAQTDHGRLSKTKDDYYLVQIRVPVEHREILRDVILNESSEIAEIVESI